MTEKVVQFQTPEDKVLAEASEAVGTDALIIFRNGTMRRYKILGVEDRADDGLPREFRKSVKIAHEFGEGHILASDLAKVVKNSGKN